MYTHRVRDLMERKKLLATSPATTVSKAAKLMAMKRVGAILVVDGGRLAGIFTERDVLFRVVARGRDPEATKVAEVMTPNPETIGPDESFGYALLVMHENGFRHLPVVENGVPVGIVSARSALDPDLEEFTAETQRRLHLRERI
jgi:CBS domain-containing protein